AVAAEGAESAYRGTIADALLALCEERGGLITRADLNGYETHWSEPVRARYLEWMLLTRGRLSGVPETAPLVPRLRDVDETGRVLALVDVSSADGETSHTTNTTVVDPP